MDAVLMWHVLEHVVNPVAVMEKVGRILKPGGIVLGELPNFRSWDAALFGRYWGGGHAPRHPWHFTPSTLTQTMSTAGLEAVRIRPAMHPGHFALSIQTLLRRGRNDTNGLVSGRTPYFPILSLALLPVALLQMPGIHSGVMRFEGRKHDG